MPDSALLAVVRRLGLCLPLLAVLVAGCADGYPEDLKYPPRADLLVVKASDKASPYPVPPGQLDASVATVGEKGGEVLDPKAIPAARRAELHEALAAIFGSPGRPRIAYRKTKPSEQLTESEKAANVVLPVVDPAAVELAVDQLQLDPSTLRAGSALYRRHCLHCHGLAGDGRGPTGPWVSPHPRDYRQGVFKFISTDLNAPARKARRDDIVRTLRQGVEGTSMPAFGLLPDHEVNQLASFVILLSLRGEVEFETLKKIKDGDLKDLTNPFKDEAPLDLFGYAEMLLEVNLSRWKAAVDAPPITPAAIPADCAPDPKTGIPPAASVERGYEKFIEKSGAAACLSCHYDFGRQAEFRPEIWGTLARPANLTVPMYKGGRRPLDIYWRVTGGIQGCAMPANPALHASAKDVWDLVNFVQALPYPRMLPEKVRDKVYVPEKPASPAGKAGH